MKRYTESYVNEMIGWYKGKVGGAKTEQEKDFYTALLDYWTGQLNKIKGGL